MKIIRLLLVAFTAAFFVFPASAQNVGTVTNHAFAIGKGAGKQGFTSLLCAATQLAVGQSAADPICRTVTGDVTIDAAGVTAIGASKVTNTMLVGPVSVAKGGTGQTSISATLDAAFGSVQGNILYRNSTVWTVLAPGTAGQLLATGGAAANVSWITASGTGTVTSAGLTNTYGLSVSGSPITTSGNISAGVSLTTITDTLGADVALSTINTYFDGPTVAQGSTGTWFCSGVVLLQNTLAATNHYDVRLYDGTTILASTQVIQTVTSANVQAALSGIITSPAGNIRISARNSDNNTAAFRFNISGNLKDNTLTCVRLG